MAWLVPSVWSVWVMKLFESAASWSLLPVAIQLLYAPLREAAQRSRAEFAMAFMAATRMKPKIMELAPIVLYRTLGPTLPDGAAAAAVLWGAAQGCASAHGDSLVTQSLRTKWL